MLIIIIIIIILVNLEAYETGSVVEDYSSTCFKLLLGLLAQNALIEQSVILD